MNISEIRPPWAGWETKELLGRGGFGAVYRIERDNFGSAESAAMKVIRIPRDESELDDYYTEGLTPDALSSRYEDYMQSIVREYAMMAKLKGSANVVYCDDVSQVRHADGIGWDIFIRMELLTPATKIMSEDYDEHAVLRLGADIAHALTICREKNIIHRDVKPQNIFVSEDGVYKLGDFGVAKAVERTSGGTKVGTYKFMAPEVYCNRPYGTGADVYSLGLVLYWFMNERRGPFVPLPPAVPTNAEEEQARARRFDGEPLPAPKHGSKALKALVLRACAFDPDARISAEALRRELKRLLRDYEDAPSKAEDATQRVMPFAPPASDALMTADKPEQAKPAGEQEEYTRGAEKPAAVPEKKTLPRAAWIAIAVVGCAAVAALVLLLTRPKTQPAQTAAASAAPTAAAATAEPDTDKLPAVTPSASAPETEDPVTDAQLPEEPEETGVPELPKEEPEERPAYLSGYQAPTALGDDIKSGIVEIEGKLYAIPCPVSEFLNAGWYSCDFGQKVDPGRWDKDYTLIYGPDHSKKLIVQLANRDTAPRNCSNCIVVDVIGVADPKTGIQTAKMRLQLGIETGGVSTVFPAKFTTNSGRYEFYFESSHPGVIYYQKGTNLVCLIRVLQVRGAEWTLQS